MLNATILRSSSVDRFTKVENLDEETHLGGEGGNARSAASLKCSLDPAARRAHRDIKI